MAGIAVLMGFGAIGAADADPAGRSGGTAAEVSPTVPASRFAGRSEREPVNGRTAAPATGAAAAGPGRAAREDGRPARVAGVSRGERVDAADSPADRVDTAALSFGPSSAAAIPID